MVWNGWNILEVSIDFRFHRASGPPPLAKDNKCVNDSDFEDELMIPASLRSNKSFLFNDLESIAIVHK